MVEVVVDDVVVEVDVEVDVDAAVVTGIVVLVVDGDDEVDEVAATDDVEPESVVAASSSLQPTIVNAMMTRETSRAVFTVGSLARFVAIT